MTALRLDDLRQYSDVLRSRSGEAVTVRFVEPRDAETLQNYFRSLLDPLPLQPLPRRHQRTAADAARSVHPCRRGRPFQRGRDHAGRWLRDHRRRSPLRVQCRHRELRVRPVDRRPLAGPGHRHGAAEESRMPRRRVRRRASVRRHAAFQRRHDRRSPANPAYAFGHSPGDWKLVRFEKQIDVAPQDIPCASWRLAAASRQLAARPASRVDELSPVLRHQDRALSCPTESLTLLPREHRLALVDEGLHRLPVIRGHGGCGSGARPRGRARWRNRTAALRRDCPSCSAARWSALRPSIWPAQRLPSCSLSSGTTRLTRPIASHRAASTRSAVNINSRAREVPTSRVSSQAMP